MDHLGICKGIYRECAALTHCDAILDTDRRGKSPLIRFLRWHRWPAMYKLRAHGLRCPEPVLFATLTAAHTGQRYLGRWESDKPLMVPVAIRAGDRVRVTMASRFGDVGITPEMTGCGGYVLRVWLDELTDFAGVP